MKERRDAWNCDNVVLPFACFFIGLSIARRLNAQAQHREGKSMSGGKKSLLAVIFILLVIGISAPFQHFSKPIFFGFVPAPIFYLVIVHLLFVCFIGYLAFFSKLHGPVENEKEFLAEIGIKEVGK